MSRDQVSERLAALAGRFSQFRVPYERDPQTAPRQRLPLAPAGGRDPKRRAVFVPGPLKRVPGSSATDALSPAARGGLGALRKGGGRRPRFERVLVPVEEKEQLRRTCFVTRYSGV